MKKLYLIILVIIAVLITLYLIVKRKLAQLSYSVYSINFDSFGVNKIAGSFRLLVMGNFLGNIAISKLNLSIYIDGYHVGNLGQDAETEITKGGILATIKFSLAPKKVVSMDHLIASLSNYGNNNYTIKGSVVVKKWFITSEIPINFTSTFKKEALSKIHSNRGHDLIYNSHCVATNLLYEKSENQPTNCADTYN